MNADRTPRMETSTAVEIAALRKLSVGELQERYRALFGRESRSRNRGWLLKRLAYRMQELRHGGLSREAREHARELAKDTHLRARLPSDFELPRKAPQKHVRDPRLPAVGTALRKEHGGELHEVAVLADGFEYRGRRYRSLSGIARAITGTSWNGYAWFGLDA
ncbi:putative bacteriophage related protein [Haliangium ochraceum DSM 14365]|uniref:Putative bacteriophage related protein n=2 Tax=Haliangium ochraceum TaxID=80816 RepID=D0LLL3_HALO1|nr:putative bacteriophage related protein [Haliangium ochraceum DSM 14365]